MALLISLALAAPAFAGQTVWKWVDEKGITHYSDTPRPGATQMELSTASRSDSAPPPSYTPSQSGNAPPAASSAARYTDFSVTTPASNDTVSNTGGQVQVALNVAPALQTGDSVTLYLDGQQVKGFPPTGLSYTLSEVPRGTHTVQGAIVDGSGKKLRNTAPVTFHVRQESIAKPPVGPTMRPPPKPRTNAGNKLPTAQPSYAALNGAQSITVDPRTNLPPKAKPAPAGPRSGN
jgi:hypothetical protein